MKTLTAEQFNKAISNKGWTQVRLASRWDVTDRHIRKLRDKAPNIPLYWFDAIAGLPDLTEMDDSDIKSETEPLAMSKKDFIANYVAKGWTPGLLKERWGYKSYLGLINQITPEASSHFIDALRALPDLTEDK